MSWFKYVFALLVLLIAIPLWRFMDLIAWVYPIHSFMILAMILWVIFFVILPLKAFVPVNRFLFLGIIIGTGFLTWNNSPLSKLSTLDPDVGHCGPLTFTGALYPLRPILNASLLDDLEVRNQICWVTKMMRKSVDSFDPTNMRNILLRPANKYKSALPAIAFYFAKIAKEKPELSLILLQETKLLAEHYTYEIHAKKYGLWDWPHSAYIKWEYGLIERNWQGLVDGIEINGSSSQ
jgi:hypothetical protein